MKTEYIELEINGIEVGAKVEYEFHKASRGLREGGLQIEPDEAAHVEIYSLYVALDDNEFHEIDLPEAVLNGIAEEIMEAL